MMERAIKMPTKIQVTMLLRGLRSFRKRLYEIKKADIKKKAEMISVPMIKNKLSDEAFWNEYLPVA